MSADLYNEYTRTTRAMYCPECGYTATFQFTRSRWRHLDGCGRVIDTTTERN